MITDKNNFANLIIGGVGKAGTTSLFEYLVAHPDVCGSTVKETKFFMPLKFGQPLLPMSEYENFWKHYHNEKYRLDASPSYLFGGEAVARGIFENLGAVKIILILREPVSRVFSWYRYVQAKRLHIPQNMSFEEYLKISFAEIDLLEKEKRETQYSRGVRLGMYSTVLPAWYKVFEGHDNIRIFFYDDLKKDTKQFVKEVCDWIEIDASLIDEKNYGKVENKTLAFKNNTLHKLSVRVSRMIPSFIKGNNSIYKKLKRTYYKASQKERHDTLNPETKKMLQDFYKPYNNELAKFLRSKNYHNLPVWLSEE